MTMINIQNFLNESEISIVNFNTAVGAISQITSLVFNWIVIKTETPRPHYHSDSGDICTILSVPTSSGKDYLI